MTTHSERHVAVVSKVDDPEKRGRIRVVCPSILGDDVTELPMWVEPVLDWGLFVIPDIGEVVEIETTSGSTLDEVLGQASIDQMNPRWRGSRFYDTKGDKPVAIPHPDFTDEHYGKKRGFHSKRHTLVFDDTEGDESITVSWRDKSGKLNQFFLTATNFGVALDVDEEEGTKLTLNLSGAGKQTQMILGDGAVSVPIGEALAEAWDNMVEQQTAFNTAVQAAVVAAVAIASAPDAGIAAAVAAAAPSLTALATADPNLTMYDAAINSDHVFIPDNEP